MNETDDDLKERLFFHIETEKDKDLDEILKEILGRIENKTETKNISSFYSDDCGVFAGCKFIDSKVVCDEITINILIAVIILLSFLIVFANSLVIAVILRNKNMRKQQGCFKLSLAGAQWIFGATFLPTIAYNLKTQIFYDEKDILQLKMIRSANTSFDLLSYHNHSSNLSGELNYVFMQIFASVGYFTSIVTVISLLMLSIDSYISVRFPIPYRFGSVMSKRTAIWCSIIIWLLAGVIVTVPNVLTESFTAVLFIPTFSFIFSFLPDEEGTASGVTPLLIYVILIWGVPFIATWITTILMWFRSRDMFSNLKTNKDDGDLRRTFIVILSSFTFTILPLTLILFYLLLASPKCLDPISSASILASFFFYTSGGFINVIIYNFFHREFRKYLRKLFYDVIAAIARVFPCFNSLLPFNLQRDRSSSFISTTLSRIRSKSRKSKVVLKNSVTSSTKSG